MTEIRAPYVDPCAETLISAAALPRRALFLDRDGVVNVDRNYVHRPDQTEWVPGIFQLVRTALGRGYLPIVVTNQAGIARGYYSEAQFLEYTRWVHGQFREAQAPLLATYYCPHHPTAGLPPFDIACRCRKPEAGMLLMAIREWQIEAAGSILVGDKQTDIDAASAAGIQKPCKVHAPRMMAALASNPDWLLGP